MFQLEQRYIVLQHGNTVRLLPSALPPRLTNEARGANRAAHERWGCEIFRAHTRAQAHTHTYPVRTSLCRKIRGEGRWRAPQPCCLNSLQKACDSSLHMCHRRSQQVISPTRKRAKAPDAQVKNLPKKKEAHLIERTKNK